MWRAPLWVALAVFVNPAFAYDCSPQRHAEARERIEYAFAQGLLQNDKRSLSVFINDALWHRLTFPQKQAFADDLVCAAAGPGKAYSSMTLRSLSTGNPVGEWNMGTLKVISGY